MKHVIIRLLLAIMLVLPFTAIFLPHFYLFALWCYSITYIAGAFYVLHIAYARTPYCNKCGYHHHILRHYLNIES